MLNRLHTVFHRDRRSKPSRRGPALEALETRILFSSLTMLGSRLIREQDFFATGTYNGGNLQFYLANDSGSAATITDFAIDSVARANLPNVPSTGNLVTDTRWWQAWPNAVNSGARTTIRIHLADIPTTLGADNSAHTLTLYYSDNTTQNFTFATPEQTDLWIPFVGFSADLQNLTVYVANQGSDSIALAPGGGIRINNQSVTGTPAQQILAPGDVVPIQITLSAALTAGSHFLVQVTPQSGSAAAWGSQRVFTSNFGTTLWAVGSESDMSDLSQHNIDYNTIPGSSVFQDEPLGNRVAPQTVANNIIASWNSNPLRPVTGQMTGVEENRIYGDLYDVAMTHHGNTEQDLSLFLSWPKPIWYLPQDAWGRMEGVGAREYWYRLEDLTREAYRGVAHGAKDIQWFAYWSLWEQGYGRGGGTDYARNHQDFYMPGAQANPLLWDRVGRISGVLQVVEPFLVNTAPAGEWRSVSSGVEISTLVANGTNNAVIVLTDAGNDGFYKGNTPGIAEPVWTNLTLTARIPTYLSASANTAYLIDPFAGVQTVTAVFNRAAGSVQLTIPVLRAGAIIVIGSSADGLTLASNWNAVSAKFAGYSDQPQSALTVPGTDIRPTVWSQGLSGTGYSLTANASGSSLLLAQGNKVFLLNSDGTQVWSKTYAGRVFKAVFSTNQDRIYIAADLAADAGVSYTDSHILSYDLAGVEQWRHKAGSFLANTALHGRTVYDLESGFTDNGVMYSEWNGYVARLDASGAVQWNISAGLNPMDIDAVPDGGALIYGSVRVQRISATGTITYTARETNSPSVECAISPTEERIAFAGNHLNIYLNGVLVAAPYVGRNIRVIKFSDDGTRIAVGTSDGIFRMYTAAGTLLWEDVDKSSYVTDIKFLTGAAGVAVMREHFAYSTSTMWKFRDSVQAFNLAGARIWRNEGAWHDQPFMGQCVVNATGSQLVILSQNEIRSVNLTANNVSNAHLYVNRPSPLPTGWQNADVGGPADIGSARFTTLGNSLTMQGGGADLAGSADQFNFTYTTLTGDGEIIARVASSTLPAPYSEAGVMIRESLAAGSKHATMLQVGRQPNDVRFKSRAATDGGTSSTWGVGKATQRWLRLVRSGDVFTSYYSNDGANWTLLKTQTIAMNSTVLIGLAVCSHSVVQPDVAGVGVMETMFDNIKVNGVSLTLAFNRPPIVNAGADIGTSGAATLDATVTDDNLPNPPGGLTYTWTAIAGPGTVTFANANAVNTTATFSTSGIYTLRLTATDGLLATADEIQITVNKNMLANPGFETDANADNFPDSWQSRTGAVRANDQVHSGAYALKVTSAATPPYTFQKPTLQANTTYTLSGWIKLDKVSTGSVYAYLRYVQPGAGTWSESQKITATTSWTQVSVTFTTPATFDPADTTNRLDLAWQLGAGDTLWLDDIDLHIGTTVYSAASPPY